MPHHRLAFTFSLTLLIAFTAAQTPDLVIEVFRHGARGPLNTTFDPNQTYWGVNVGQLTPIGMRMHYVLGATLQNKYPELLTSYDPDTIYVRSTDVNRTIMSGYSHMYGVFEVSGPNFTDTVNVSTAIPPYVSPFVAQFNANLSNITALPNDFQVVPIEVIPEDEDYILAAYAACPMASDWSDANAEDSDTLSVFQNEMNNIVTYLQSKGLAINTFEDLYTAGDNAICNKVQGIELPANVTPNTQNYLDLKFAFEWYTAQLVEGTPNQVELYAVNLLDAISGYMNSTINGTSTLNFVFLSAHDTTLMGLLSAFNITTADCLLSNYNNAKNNVTIETPNCIYPQFASDVIFEFYNTAEPYILFYYNGTQIPFCGNANNNCTYTQFQSYITQVTGGLTTQDYMEMCEFPQVMMENQIHTYKVVIIIVAVVAFFVLSVMSFVIYRLHRKNKILQEHGQQLLSGPQDSRAGNL